MFPYYGSECFSNKSLLKQELLHKKTIPKLNQGSSNAQKKDILKLRQHRKKGLLSDHTVL